MAALGVAGTGSAAVSWRLALPKFLLRLLFMNILIVLMLIFRPFQVLPAGSMLDHEVHFAVAHDHDVLFDVELEEKQIV
jgi:hypothetical protein